MQVTLKRFFALLMGLVLLFSMAPSAYAATTQTGIMLFDFSDNGDYTTRLNSQLSVSYKPNGSGTTRTAYIKNLGWHFARYGNVPYADDPLYCIEPWRDYGASTSGNSVDRGVTLSGSGSTTGSSVWYALPEARRNAIALILLYSDQMWNDAYSVFNYKRDDNPNVPLRVATQMLVYEVVCGLRDPNTFILNSTNECGTAGDIFYNACVAAVSDFAPNYNELVANVQSAMEIPSFTSASSSSAPTITLTGEETSVYDSNGVLANWSFTDGNGAEFSQSGNTLYITQNGTISESTVFKATRSIPSAANSTFNLWYMSGSTYQTTISLASASSGTLTAYFKLQGAPTTGNLNVAKTTEDGSNLSGWQFGIYSDSGCTTLISGPHTTNTSGKLSVTGLSAGTIYVKEMGHTDSSINALYTCSSSNPQKVTLTAGQTSSVSFYNKLNTGGIKLVKKTNTGENLAGWQIAVYTNSNCTTQISGSPFTTAADGTITISGLTPQTLYAKEISSGDSYWACDTAVKTVNVESGKITEVTFTNTHYGRIEFQKTTNTGNYLDGWTFRVRDSEGNVVGDYVSDENGYACTENLPLGRYTVVELPTDDYYWNCEIGFHDVTVKAGQTVVDEWLNREQGLGWFHKATNTGENLEGWEITIYSDAACTQKVSSVTTNEDGKVGLYLDPGVYYAKETGDENGRFEDEYWLVDETIREFEIKPHADTDIRFANTHYGNVLIKKAMPDGGSVEGWDFDMYRKADNTHIGTYTSGENGSILSDYVEPGEYLIYEKIPEDSLYYCDTVNPQTVTITAGKTAEVTFTNCMRLGEISILKVNHKGEPLAGATFLLEWSEDGSTWEPVTYTAEKGAFDGTCTSSDLSDGCLTSGEDGLVSFTGLHPLKLYRLVETAAPENYLLLTDVAYEGGLELEKELRVELTVVNSPVYELPMTGSYGSLILKYSRIFCFFVCTAMLAYPFVFRKKVR